MREVILHINRSNRVIVSSALNLEMRCQYPQCPETVVRARYSLIPLGPWLVALLGSIRKYHTTLAPITIPRLAVVSIRTSNSTMRAEIQHL